MTAAALPRPPARLVRAQGASSADWLAGLPALAGSLLRRWDLTAERVAEPGGRDSLTVLVRTASGGRAALKICAPSAPATLEEAALRRWNGLGAVRLLREAPREGALLLERLHGETSLRSLPEAKASLEAVSAVRRLWVEPGAGHPFPSVAERTGAQAERMRAGAPREAGGLVAEALRLRAGLLAAAPAGRLLHGDFRQGAVLASDDERARWLAVGPEPVVGEPAYDLARLVRDRLHDLVASAGGPAVTRRRVARLADAVEVEPERLRAWSLFRAVESGVRNLAAGNRADGEMLLEFAGWL
ncbi:aminoglycoside phosphotransferase family protein [Streptomyces sp. DSM 44917]|uniref:Aminoglycoside phosphotransferase family protein n=1 Tax=Streptomyces boetiae TaxID=3075541 RepID=A0ABU2LFD9_9ACTN|nr:aminoglycoside phosphotransferase family protein [Streptomyces sp. DSM 44917]MDT0310211.1 aminoglycoside phosphotransferase family protein [Streptomyces sp. DSM 44917]